MVNFRTLKISLLIGFACFMVACPSRRLLMNNGTTGELKVYGKVVFLEDDTGAFITYPQGPKINKNATLRWEFDDSTGTGSAEIISYGRVAYSWVYDVDELTPTWIEADSETEEPDGLVHESPADDMLRSKVTMTFAQLKDRKGIALPERVTVRITQTLINKDGDEEEVQVVTFTSSENR